MASHRPYSPDIAPCDFWLFPKLGGFRWDSWGDERGCDEGHWHAHKRGLPWGLPEVVGTVQQGHCNWRRLLRRGLEFHVCTLNKSAHMKKVWKLIVCTSSASLFWSLSFSLYLSLSLFQYNSLFLFPYDCLLFSLSFSLTSTLSFSISLFLFLSLSLSLYIYTHVCSVRSFKQTS